ncbi:1-phosphatidylinositol phosphodiesterase [Cytospora mali]|uniref:1-phosphatidylinositol phosphodiesterase n=1 Tax=Cytospora mali TaxID=578113 RepID=A0A194VYK7_CYTMA|nr:1-phosphatidylinositol phosphodiesterase [Valsa mali]
MTNSPTISPPNLPSWSIEVALDPRPPLNPYCHQQPEASNNKTKMTKDSNTSKSSTWVPQGPTEQGFLIPPDHPHQHVRAQFPPSIATHRGQLWMVWTDFSDQIWYATTTPESHGETFAAGSQFPYVEGDGKHGVPVIANLNGILHAIVVSAKTGQMKHYIYNADEQFTWIHQEDSLPDGCVAGKKSREAALVAFHNKLFLAWIGEDKGLCYTEWDIHSRTWMAMSRVSEGDYQGTPAMFVLNGSLHVLSETADGSAEIMGYRYDYTESGWTWAPADDVSEGKAAKGVSAASYGNSAYLGFIEDDAVYVAAHKDGASWQKPEHVGGEDVVARFPPQIAVINGRVHCIFAGKWRGDLHWFSRPVLGYDLKTWMGSIDDDKWLSNITIPGTHDSCARSNVPFVRTQYLSISQQLALGIRFFDLRLRRHDDGKLYCYHGGMPINLPKGLSFQEVMDQVWQFIGPEDGQKATETVLISINNDDKSAEQKSNPKIFYDAVKEAVEITPTYEDGSKRWYTEPVTAKLGDVRGKAVLLRRYYGDPDVEPTERMGLDLEKWLDDNPDFTIVTANGVRVRLQDKWKYATRCSLNELVTSKQTFVQEMMGRALGTLKDTGDEEDGGSSSELEETWFINFCSAVGDPVEHGEVAEAKWIAVGAHSDMHFFGKWIEGMNVRTRDYLRTMDDGAGRGGTKRLGVVNLDYPELPDDSDLVARLIETNF